MKPPSRSAWAWTALVFLAFVATRAPAQTTPALLADESFTYANGSIVGTTGGSGWNGAWINPYSQSPLAVSGNRLIHDGASTIEAAGLPKDILITVAPLLAAYKMPCAT